MVRGRCDVRKTIRRRNGDCDEVICNRTDKVGASFLVEPGDNRCMCLWCYLTFPLRLEWTEGYGKNACMDRSPIRSVSFILRPMPRYHQAYQVNLTDPP